MMLIENSDPRVWDAFVESHGGHVLQTSAWGQLKSRFGWRAYRFALTRNDEWIAGAQMLVRDLPLGLKFAYVPRGPIGAPDTRAELFRALDQAARARGAFVLRVEPNGFEFDAPSNSKLAPSIQPQTTIHVDLTRTLDTILAEMKPKWRYNIRLSERKEVRVRVGDARDTELYYRLMQTTSERDQFAIHSLDYYRAAFELLGANARARLFIAEYAGDALAAIFVTAVGDEAIYLYGASSNAHRERMPNHALHWAAMQWAKSRGCKRYDLWGLGATTDANQEDAHGLFRFKQGFGGALVQYAPAFDLVYSRAQFAVYERAVQWRRQSATQ